MRILRGLVESEKGPGNLHRKTWRKDSSTVQEALWTPKMETNGLSIRNSAIALICFLVLQLNFQSPERVGQSEHDWGQLGSNVCLSWVNYFLGFGPLWQLWVWAAYGSWQISGSNTTLRPSKRSGSGHHALESPTCYTHTHTLIRKHTESRAQCWQIAGHNPQHPLSWLTMTVLRSQENASLYLLSTVLEMKGI